MKLLIRILLVVPTLISAVFFIGTSSCKKDKCKGVSCQHEGICHSGTCTCTFGYEGANCSVPWRNKFLGNWSQTGNSGSLSGQFAVSVVADPVSVDSVMMINFDNTFAEPVVAYVTASDCLVIPHQLIQDTGLVEVQGYIYYVSGGNITVFYERLNVLSNKLDTVNTHW